jgi:hypothetical protein
MRYVWTDAGDDPSWGVGDANGINGYYAPIFDSLTDDVVVEAARRGHVVGICIPHGHLAGTPDEIAKVVSVEYARISKLIPTTKLRVMFNYEEHEPDLVADRLEAWRELRPFVATSWSPEGMQGGWMDPEFVERVLACRVRVVPQAYAGAGRPLRRRESDVVKADVVRAGFPEHIVSCFYDAAQLGEEWEGFAYTVGHLPS